MVNKHADEIRKIKQNVIDFTFRYVETESDGEKLNDCVSVILKQLNKLICILSPIPKHEPCAETLLELLERYWLYENSKNSRSL